MANVANLGRFFVVGSMLGSLACADMDHADAPGTAPVIAENGDFRVEAPLGTTAVVDVKSRAFASYTDLYRFAVDELGGEPVYDDTGALIGARGVSVAAGDVRFRDEDTGEMFDADDLAQAYLGGAAGKIHVAGKALDVRATRLATDAPLGHATQALSDDSESCVGGDCISGHSWRTNYVVYRSVGSESKQKSGGNSPYSYACCTGGGSIVHQNGVAKCKVVTEWEQADPENGIYKPIPVAWEFRPAQTCTRETLNNVLRVTATAISPSNTLSQPTTREERNVTEVSMSAWGVGVGVSFLGIDDVAGVCGLHSGTRGGTSRTRAGSATDAQCDPQSGGGGGWFFNAQPIRGEEVIGVAP